MVSTILCTLRSLGCLSLLVVPLRPSFIPLLGANRRYYGNTPPYAQETQITVSQYLEGLREIDSAWRQYAEDRNHMWHKKADTWRKENKELNEKLLLVTPRTLRHRVGFSHSLAEPELIPCSVKH